MVNLIDVVDNMGMAYDSVRFLYDREIDEIVMVFTDALNVAEELEEDADLEEAAQHTESDVEEMELAVRIVNDDGSVFVSLPSQWDIDEYSIMCDFVDTLPDSSMRDRLAHKLRGSGAFRRFKDGVHQYDIADAWYRYRDQRLIVIAQRWCQRNDIPLTVTSDGPHAAERAELARNMDD